jgi:hypothetical protein
MLDQSVFSGSANLNIFDKRHICAISFEIDTQPVKAILSLLV